MGAGTGIGHACPAHSRIRMDQAESPAGGPVGMRVAWPARAMTGPMMTGGRDDLSRATGTGIQGGLAATILTGGGSSPPDRSARRCPSGKAASAAGASDRVARRPGPLAVNPSRARSPSPPLSPATTPAQASSTSRVSAFTRSDHWPMVPRGRRSARSECGWTGSVMASRWGLAGSDARAGFTRHAPWQCPAATPHPSGRPCRAGRQRQAE